MPRSIRACSSSPPHSNAMAHSSPNGRTRTIQPLAETPRRAAILKKLRSRPTVTGSAIALAILIVVILAAPFFAPQNPYDLANLNLLDGRLPPGAASMDGKVYLLGTDDQGRDMFSAILYGLRISLMVGLSAVGLATAIGSMAGLVAAYIGGFVDTVLMRKNGRASCRERVCQYV